MEGYTLKMWDQITNMKMSDLQKQVVVDFGCGSGRLIETIRQKNGIAIGFDLSYAVEAAQEIFESDPNVLICQADILKSPIRPNSVDGAFSIGVLHHTANPEAGFKKMVDCVKPDGWISISVYGRGGYYDNFFVSIYRRIFKALWPVFGHYPPLVYSYFAIYCLRPILRVPILRTLVRPFLTFFPFMDIPDTDWSVLNTFDSITPSNQYGFTVYEIFQWFKAAGLKNIEPSNWAGASMHARK
jgi:SAM-dependent methyltransferase